MAEMMANLTAVLLAKKMDDETAAVKETRLADHWVDEMDDKMADEMDQH